MPAKQAPAASPQYIVLHAAAPPQPQLGQPCNGCGVCCAYAPCPLSRALLGHRHGACPALQWQSGQYRCGLLLQPAQQLGWLPRWLEAVVRRLIRRWIAAGHGCDCAARLEPEVGDKGGDRA